MQLKKKIPEGNSKVGLTQRWTNFIYLLLKSHTGTWKLWGRHYHHSFDSTSIIYPSTRMHAYTGMRSATFGHTAPWVVCTWEKDSGAELSQSESNQKVRLEALISQIR